ncbi:MAG: hypothetical protein NUV50_00170 [Rhodospirillales bacterium]|nr:hypothetical protein [Rhodospirillales bacterium]
MTEKPHGPEKRDGSHAANTRPWITLPILDWILFTRRQREIIYQLIDDNDFRVEGVYFLIRRAIVTAVILISIHAILTYLAGFFPSLPMMLILWSAWIWLMSVFRERAYTLSTIGVITKGKIEDVWFGSIRIPAWFVKYKYRDHDNNDHINTSMYGFYINISNINKNDTINIIYEYDNPENGGVYSSKGFKGSCISKKRYRILEQMKRMGE